MKSEIQVKRPKIIIKKLGRESKNHVIVGQAYENTVEIDPRQDSKEYLDTLIHEILHLFLPDATERTVTKLAIIMTDAIWRQGYRRTIK